MTHLWLCILIFCFGEVCFWVSLYLIVGQLLVNFYTLSSAIYYNGLTCVRWTYNFYGRVLQHFKYDAKNVLNCSRHERQNTSEFSRSNFTLYTQTIALQQYILYKPRLYIYEFERINYDSCQELTYNEKRLIGR